MITRTCEKCGVEFRVKPSAIKRGRGKFCSRRCFALHNWGGERNPKYAAALKEVKCLQCGTAFKTYQSQIKNGGGKYCSYSCKSKYENSGERHYAWNGGKFPANGYIAVSVGQDRKKYEHQVIAALALGRPLKKGEVVHHVNGNKTDNRNSNLIICSSSYHHRLHQNMARRYQIEHFGEQS